MAKAKKTDKADKAAREMAVVEFEAWKDDPTTLKALNNPELRRRCEGNFPGLRLAYAVMLKSKPELVAMIESLWDDEKTVDALFDMLESASALFKGLHTMAEQAHTRALIAGAVVLLRKDKAATAARKKAA